MIKSVTDIVSRICNTCIYDRECPRASWNPQPKHYKPVIGGNEECPMMQFLAEEDTDNRSFRERLLDHSLPPRLTISDTWYICENCKYATVAGNTIDISKNFSTVCIDCPNLSIRDAQQEVEAEAAMS